MTLRSVIASMVNTAVTKTIDDRLPGLIEEVMAEKFAKAPHAPLSAMGFTWAFVLELRRWWPNVPKQTAAEWLREYIGEPIGSKDYLWTAATAQELAREYVAECG